MNAPTIPLPPRIIVVDDNPAIHEDFRKILCPPPVDAGLDSLEADIFGEDTDDRPQYQPEEFDLVTALQGEEGYHKILAARDGERPFSLAFVDGRMPPGWDGVKTIQQIWKAVPDLQIVFCTAFSDYSWSDVLARIGGTDNLIILKKPFDTVEVAQLARTLTQKWALRQRVQFQTRNLQRMVDLRTEEIRRVNYELVQANDHLTRAIGIRDGIIAGITHELRTPLNGIVGSVELLGYEVASAEGKDGLQTILECARTLAGHVDNLVALAEKPAGSEAPSPGIQIGPLVAEIVEAHRDAARGKGLFLRQSLAPDLPPEIPGNPVELRQILLGILSNAIKFTESGLVTVSVRIDPDRKVLRIEVRDTGLGIDPEALKSIFEPFIGSDMSLTRSQGGLGLGLAVGMRLAKRMGGTIVCSSVPGKGSAFEVLLPAVPGAPVPG